MFFLDEWLPKSNDDDPTFVEQFTHFLDTGKDANDLKQKRAKRKETETTLLKYVEQKITLGQLATKSLSIAGFAKELVQMDNIPAHDRARMFTAFVVKKMGLPVQI